MKDSAVTPVVGVMLMLTITIIAVAVIAAFASGLVNTSDTSPIAEISVTTSGFGDDFKIIFEHKGGDPIDPNSTKVSTLIKSAESEAVEHTFRLSEISDKTLMPGMRVSTSNLARTCELLGANAERLSTDIARSTPLEVKMYYIPTSAVIFASTVLLEEK